jgi:hypothetical protein
MKIPTSFVVIITLTRLLNMAMTRYFEVMLGQALNHSAEFCNFVECHIFENF